MSVKKTTGAFNDCYVVMDQMLQRGGGVAKFPDFKRAAVFRHRCYRARNLLYKAAERSCPIGQIPSTPYDDLYLQLPTNATEITFRLRSKDDIPDLEFADAKPNFAKAAEDLDFE